MITKKQFEEAINQINSVFKSLDERLQKLENTPKVTPKRQSTKAS